MIFATALIIVMGLATSSASALTFDGRSSWYGGSCDGQDNNIPRWIPNDGNYTPGIALRRYDTPRKYFLLTLVRTKRKVVVRHTDYGPATWTGRNIDVNYSAVQGLGYSGCRDDYPTDSTARVTLLKTKKQRRYWVAKTATKIDDARIAR